MAKLQVSSTKKLFALLFCFLLIASYEMQVAEAELCQKRSQTWTGFCGISRHCKNQCKKEEYAHTGACHRQGFGMACFCYFNKKKC